MINAMSSRAMPTHIITTSPHLRACELPERSDPELEVKLGSKQDKESP